MGNMGKYIKRKNEIQEMDTNKKTSVRETGEREEKRREGKERNVCDYRRKAGRIQRKLKKGDKNGERETCRRKGIDGAERTAERKPAGRARETVVYEKKNRK